MSSSDCSCSPEDEFYRALEKSLTVEYSSQKMCNFISELLVAISNLDDDSEECFISDGQEYCSSNSYDFFTSSESNGFGELRQTLMRKNEVTAARKVVDTSVDMFEDVGPHELVGNDRFASQRQTVDVSVDMFEDVDDISVDMFDDVSLPELTPKQDDPSTPVKVSGDGYVDMVPVSQNDNEMMDTDRDCSDKINPHEYSKVAGIENEEVEDPERVEHPNMNEQRDVEALLSDVGAVNTKDNTTPKIMFSRSNDESAIGSEGHLRSNEHPRSTVHTSQELLQQNVELENEELNQSLDVLVRVPSNISYYEPNEHDRTLSVASYSSQISIQIIQRTCSDVTRCPEIAPTKENASQGSGSARSHRSLLPVKGTADESMLNLSQGTLFEEFSSAALKSAHNYATRTRRSSSRSKNFRGFSPVPLMTQRAIPHNSATRLRRSSSKSTSFRGFTPVPLFATRSESDLNTTICEEYDRYETARNSATQIDFNFEEANTQCFLEIQTQASSAADRRKFLIDEIEKLIFKLNNDLVCGRKLAIEVPYTVSWNNCGVNSERLCLRPLDRPRCIIQKRRIAMVTYMLSIIYKLLIENESCTKREIYYSDPEFTHSQLQVDKAINDVCLILNASPWEMGILSSSKGLIAGSIKLTLKDDTVLDVGSIAGGILLPHQTMTIKKVETSAKFVLLVEKHTIYEKLLLENIPNRLGPCILVTGKGYPDINTRAILKKIWDDCKCPIYALVDADPHGIEIMLTYRHGSMNMSPFSDDLAIPSIRWIGVYPSEMKTLRLHSMPLTTKDVNRLDGMITRTYLSKKVYKELLMLKKTLKKAEVEALTSSQIVGSIDSYLSKKIKRGNFD